MAQLDEIARRVSGPCELLKLADCGHSPFKDQPEKVLSAVERFRPERCRERTTPRHQPGRPRARAEPFLPDRYSRRCSRSSRTTSACRTRRSASWSRCSTRCRALLQTLAGFVVDRFGARRVLLSAASPASYAGTLVAGLRDRLRDAGARRGARRPRQQRVPSRRFLHPQRARQQRRASATPSARTASPATSATRWRRSSASPWRRVRLARRAAGAAAAWRGGDRFPALAARSSATSRSADARRSSAQGGLAADRKACWPPRRCVMCFVYFALISAGLHRPAELSASSAMIALYGVAAAARLERADRLPARRGGGHPHRRLHRRAHLAPRPGRGGRPGGQRVADVRARAAPGCRRARCRCCSRWRVLRRHGQPVARPDRARHRRRRAPTGRVYGFVYSGLDVGSMRRRCSSAGCSTTTCRTAVFYTVVAFTGADRC